MFVPAGYRSPAPSWARALMLGNPLALLTSNGPRSPHATHLPVIFHPEQPDGLGEELTGAVLLGHLNRANPHWAALAEGGQRGLLVFTGPHSYVTPELYERTPAAPTWNFTSVHVEGEIRPLPAGEPTLAVVTATVLAFEERFGVGWDMDASLDYFREIVPGVGAFELVIDSWDAMFKLSQEKEPSVRHLVSDSFAQGTAAQRELAELMGRLPTGAAGRDGTTGGGCPLGAGAAAEGGPGGN